MTPTRGQRDEAARAPIIWRFGNMKGGTVSSADGDLGTFEDFYFDDRSWTGRHLVVDTGGWLGGRRVLVSPRAITGIAPTGLRLETNLRREQVERCPDVDMSRPVSRADDAKLAAHYGYPLYWVGSERWGAGPLPAQFLLAAEVTEASAAMDDRSHLLSARDVTGFGIEATDGELGHVEDFLVDEETWAIRYLIVDPRNWWPGEHVIVGVDWLNAVHRDRRTVSVEVTRETVRDAPVWRPDDRVDREYETRLYRHHGRSGYWEAPPDRWMLLPPAA